MLKKEHEILVPFLKQPWQPFTFGEIKKATKKASESYIYTRLKRLVQQGILTEERKGNIVLYSLYLKNPKTVSFAGFTCEYLAWNASHLPHEMLTTLLSQIPTDFFVFLVTGSYSRKQQKKGSDIDVVILCDDATDPQKIYAELSHTAEMAIPAVHLYVFTRSQFLSMLLDKKANYGKEIAANNLILAGGQIYYRIIREAIAHGFSGEHLSGPGRQ